MQTMEQLVKTMQQGSGDQKWEAAVALGRLGDVRAVKPLVRAPKDRNPMLRSAAACALGDLGHGKAVKGLTRALRDKEWKVREQAAFALGRIGESQGLRDLARALADSDWRVRVASADALGEMGDAQAIGPLADALRDKDPAVRRHVALAMGDESASSTLQNGLGDDDSAVRTAAADAIDSIRQRPGAEAPSETVVTPTLDDEVVRLARIVNDARADYATRLQAVKALCETGDPSAAPLLVQSLADHEAFVVAGDEPLGISKAGSQRRRAK